MLKAVTFCFIVLYFSSMSVITLETKEGYLMLIQERHFKYLERPVLFVAKFKI